MGPDEKDVGTITAYVDGEPVTASATIGPEITAVDLERIKKATEDIQTVWESVRRVVTIVTEDFGEWIRSVATQIEEKHELETAMRWASCYYRPVFNKYRHTKKKRTRKKYEKKILDWYREEVLGKW
ncbi:Uncharacterised protein [uncultured Flavonifractor sp.]|nr:Uncharacterised protein [uncultured Flavonifractor sp.]